MRPIILPDHSICEHRMRATAVSACLFLLSISIAPAVSPQTAAADSPNVIVILTDDQGWGDLSVNGNTNLGNAQHRFLSA